MRLLEVDKLACGYGRQVLLREVAFELEEGGARVVVGPNGAGKSTLLKTISSSIRPIGGRVALDGEDLFEMDEGARARRVSMLMQIQPLDPGLTVEELVKLGRTPHLGTWGHLDRKDMEAVDEAIVLCRLEELRAKKLSLMSGGERQRARLAMVLAQRTRLILLDEPTNHLDVEHRYLLHEIISQVRKERGCGVLMVSHSLGDAKRFGDSTLLVHGGRVRQFDAGDYDGLEDAVREISGVPSEWVY